VNRDGDPIRLARWRDEHGTIHLGITDDPTRGWVDLHALHGSSDVPGWLLTMDLKPSDVLAAAREILREDHPREPWSASATRFILPVAPDEVWGAGVTYERSRDARREESRAQEAIYAVVYEAVRPELFFKAPAGRTQGPGEPVGLRRDAVSQVPEPELTVIVGPDGAPFGYTVGNDMTARDIEGKNPLYLPQAKIYQGSSAMGPVLTLQGSLDVSDLHITCTIRRRSQVAFHGETTTARLHRSIDSMIAYLRAEWPLAPWTALMTGTGIVPPDYFTLEDGDVIAIAIEGIGVLENPVRRIAPDWAAVPEPEPRLLVIHPTDNVAVALGQLAPGYTGRVGDQDVVVRDPIPFGHKVAVRPIAPGERVMKYGAPIGVASRAIETGEHVHTHNVESARGRGDLKRVADDGARATNR
jgi:2-dehydro-3-deoxy-D-arabinonate dehydratase